MKINSICIVGGGSAGWMSASALIKQFPDLNIILVESPNIPTVGVGESTIARINFFMDTVGLKDSDWMKECNATYKSSIQFTDFKEKGHSFQYPFGFLNYNGKEHGVSDWFWIEKECPIEDTNFAEFYHDSMIALKHNKFVDSGLEHFDFKYDTAYHMDAALFGEWLKNNVCIPNGVKHILGEVKSFAKRKDGSLDYIVTENETISADLFIDCTGFSSLLLEQIMGSEFESFHDTLMNDSAVATIIPYIDKETEMTAITNCTAIENGWVWNIPLWNRIGTGYVYSSQFASKEQATEEFIAHLGERGKTAEFRHIKIKHGVHKKSWVKNVVGVGLANGFIEPLESTGLVLTHEAIHLIIDTLGQRDRYINQYDVDSFNFGMYDLTKGFKDFVSIHYALSTRNDTPYWKHVTENMSYSPKMNNWETSIQNEYQDLAEGLHTYNSFERLSGRGLLYVAAGFGYSPVSKRKMPFQLAVNQPNLEKTKDAWIEHRNNLLKKLENAPSQYEYLKKNIYNK